MSSETAESALNDWSTFRAALRADSSELALVDACRSLREWLDLPEDECMRRVRDAAHSLEEARTLLKAKPLVVSRLARECFPGVPALNETMFAALFARVERGEASADDLRYLQHSSLLHGIAALIEQTFPRAALPVAPPDPQQEALLGMLPDLERAMHACATHLATPSRVAALRVAIDTFAAVGTHWTPPVPTDHAWWLGMAHYALGSAHEELGAPANARDAFTAGAEHYERAGAGIDAQWMRDRAIAIDRGRRGDFDAIATTSAQALLHDATPLERCESLADLASASHHAGDRFEFARLGRELAESLVTMGYADPESHERQAMQGWVQTAAADVRGGQLLERLAAIAKLWVLVMGARASERLPDGSTPDADGATRAEGTPRGILAVLMELADEADSVGKETGAELSVWFGISPQQFFASVASPAETSDEATSPQQRAEAKAARGVELDAALYELRLACNAGVTEAHELEARRLIYDAESMGSRVHLAKAHLEHAYVLLALQRFAEVSAATEAAVRALAPASPPGAVVPLDTFATSHERAHLLNVALYNARAALAEGDFDRVLLQCTPMIEQLEQQRDRVSAPYQQAAFLATRVEFYEYAAAAAWKLSRHDLLLDITERLKASGASELGHIPVEKLDSATAQSLALLDRQYAEVNAAIAATAFEKGRESELGERRLRIATARAIARRRARRSLRLTNSHEDSASTRDALHQSALTISSVQQCLANNEAALSWFWLSNERLLLQVIDWQRYECIPIALDASQRETMGQYLQHVTALGATSVTDGQAAQLDALIDALAPVLLPAAARDLLRDTQRLVLSPHRTLHLFPFHAIAWGEGGHEWLAQRFVVRYAPNVSTLLVPWRGKRDGAALAIGVESFDDAALPPIVNAEQEVREVAAAYEAEGQFRLNLRRAEFVHLPLRDYRVLHFTTHGSSVQAGDAVDDPMSCGIAMHDGLLDGWQLNGLDLAAEVVVVAACYSGQRAIGGRGLAQLPGDDLLGLQAVLFDAGVGSVLGALWPVDNDSARAILVEFHRAFAGGAAADVALQSATRTFLANPFRRRTRYDWAPFFLISARNPA